MFKNLKLSAIKTAFLALLPLLLQVKFSLIGGVPTVQWPDLHTLFPDFGHVAATALVYYELVARLVPSFDNNSLFHLLGQILNALLPNHAVTDDGGVGYHVQDETVISKPGAGGTGLSVA
jgi:hypothetical protein